MKTPEKLSRLSMLEKRMRNRSPKRLQRLLHSLAALEYSQVWHTLPGSVRRSLNRHRL